MDCATRRPSRGRPRVATIAGCLLALSVGQASAADTVGALFPDFAAYDQNNQLFRLSDQTGKPVVIHVCSLWCTPCRALAQAYPDIAAELDASLGAGNFIFVDLLLEDLFGGATDQADAQTWQGAFGGPPSILHLDGAAGIGDLQAMLIQLGFSAFPTTIVIDGDRKVAGVIEGWSGDPQAFAETVEQMVGNATLTVDVDIKPGSDANCFNINGRGVVPVAILGNDGFDVSQVDAQSLSFGGLEVRVRGNKGPLCGLEDINADGVFDLVCKFEDNASYWELGEDNASLSGTLLDGTEFEGSDSICIVP